MPKERLQVDSGLRIPGITPEASPVDTFQRTNAGSGLAQLAQGLSTVAPSLARFTATYNERTNTEQQAQGQDAARKYAESGRTYAQAIRDGVIPRGSSPFFVAGFKEQFGRVAADRWQSDLTLAVAKDEKLRTTTNLSDYDQFVQQHREQWMQQNVDPSNRDQWFETGFGHRADAYAANEREQFSAQLASRIEKFSEDAHFAEVKKHVLDNIDKFTPEQIANDLTNLNDDLVGQGRDGTTVNQVTARAVASAALERAQMGDHGAMRMLDILKFVKGGKPDATGARGILSNLEYTSKILDGSPLTGEGGVRRDIGNMLYSADERERKRQEDYLKDKTQAVETAAVRALMQNPSADISSFVSQAGDVPKALDDLTRLQKNAGELKNTVTDQIVKQSLYSELWTEGDAVGVPTIISAMNNHKLSVTDANFLIEQINTRDRMAKEKGTSVFSDPQFSAVDATLAAPFTDPLTKVVRSDAVDRVRYAQALLREQWVSYIQKHPEALHDPDGQKAANVFLVESADRIQKQQLQGLMGSITPAPKPEFQTIEQKLPKAAVMTMPSFQKMAREVSQGAASPETLRMLQMYGISSPMEISQFIRSQARLLGVKLGEDGTQATKEPTPTKQP